MPRLLLGGAWRLWQSRWWQVLRDAETPMPVSKGGAITYDGAASNEGNCAYRLGLGPMLSHSSLAPRRASHAQARRSGVSS